MLTFVSAIILLFAGYFIYSKVVEKVFVVDDDRKTPAYTKTDGIDYVPMSWWRGWLIQLLNIAGLGPVFGAIAGTYWLSVPEGLQLGYGISVTVGLVVVGGLAIFYGMKIVQSRKESVKQVVPKTTY